MSEIISMACTDATNFKNAGVVRTFTCSSLYYDPAAYMCLPTFIVSYTYLSVSVPHRVVFNKEHNMLNNYLFPIYVYCAIYSKKIKQMKKLKCIKL